MKHKTIGILGGLGHAASANLYSNIIKVSQKKYFCVQDSDFPPVIMYSSGIEGFDETGVVDEEKVISGLIKGVKVLESCGADFIVIACNTVHIYLWKLKEEVSIPILSIIDETMKKVSSCKGKVGILASETTIIRGLYSKALEEKNIPYNLPKDEDMGKVTKLILEIMKGEITKGSIEGIKDVIKYMKEDGAEAIILACTELPIALSGKDLGVKVYDTTMILAEAAVDRCLNDR